MLIQEETSKSSKPGLSLTWLINKLSLKLNTIIFLDHKESKVVNGQYEVKKHYVCDSLVSSAYSYIGWDINLS